MKYTTLNQRQRVTGVFDQPPLQPHVEVSAEHAAKIATFKEQRRLAFLIDGEITNFREQRSLGNTMKWDSENSVWVIAPIATPASPPQ